VADDSFAAHLPALTGSVLGTVASGLVGSYIGIGGTAIGLAAGSVIFGIVSWFIERWVRAGNALAKAKAEAVRQRGGRPLNQHETQIITAISNQKHRRPLRWKLIGSLAAATAVITVAVFVAASLVARKPVSAIVSPPAVSPTSAPATVPASPSHARSASPSASPTLTSPSPSSVSSPESSPSVSASPSVSLSPSVSPSESPESTAPVTAGP